MNFYNKIDSMCKLRGVSKKRMCEDIGLSYNTYNSMLKRQSKNITIDVIESIADYLDVYVDYLVRNDITDPNYGKNNNASKTSGFYQEKGSDEIIDISSLSEEAQKELRGHYEYLLNKETKKEGE